MAAGGADLTLRMPNDQVTYIFDNEPRNQEIVKRMYAVIEKDYNVVIWPNHIQLKDVNEMIVSGISVAEIKNIIDKNTFRKLEALEKLSHYKKV